MIVNGGTAAITTTAARSPATYHRWSPRPCSRPVPPRFRVRSSSRAADCANFTGADAGDRPCFTARSKRPREPHPGLAGHLLRQTTLRHASEALGQPLLRDKPAVCCHSRLWPCRWAGQGRRRWRESSKPGSSSEGAARRRRFGETEGLGGRRGRRARSPRCTSSGSRG
jgi:hypothetical protein